VAETQDQKNKLAEDQNEIRDEQFMRDLQKLRQLRTFLNEQAIPLRRQDGTSLSFGSLNSLRSNFLQRGRYPDSKEWTELEKLTEDLFAFLDEPLRRKFIATQLPKWVPYMVGLLGCVAFVSIVGCTFLAQPSQWNVPLYLIWLASLGAIGSMSFVGMNVLSIQDDATFDLSNRSFLIFRIVLGALFGTVITLPFGFKTFTTFINSLLSGGAEVSASLTVDSLMLLLPFILGFSTSLVIMILNQFIEATQSFFGKKGTVEGEMARASRPTGL
jgi:hypothetical protein